MLASEPAGTIFCSPNVTAAREAPEGAGMLTPVAQTQESGAGGLLERRPHEIEHVPAYREPFGCVRIIRLGIEDRGKPCLLEAATPSHEPARLLRRLQIQEAQNLLSLEGPFVEERGEQPRFEHREAAVLRRSANARGRRKRLHVGVRSKPNTSRCTWIFSLRIGAGGQPPRSSRRATLAQSSLIRPINRSLFSRRGMSSHITKTSTKYFSMTGAMPATARKNVP